MEVMTIRRMFLKHYDAIVNLSYPSGSPTNADANQDKLANWAFIAVEAV